MPDQEWYRAWRHDELDRAEQMVANRRYWLRAKAKQLLGRARLVAAMVLIFLNVWDAVGR